MATRGVEIALPSAPSFAALPPLALYIHIPWCIRKCPYCDFNSHERRGAIPEAQYVDALVADLEFALPSIWGRRIASVFFGICAAILGASVFKADVMTEPFVVPELRNLGSLLLELRTGSHLAIVVDRSKIVPFGSTA